MSPEDEEQIGKYVPQLWSFQLLVTKTYTFVDSFVGELLLNMRHAI